MENKSIHRLKTITEFHRVRGLSMPEHPLISLVDYSEIEHLPENNSISWVFDFYSISLKRNFSAKIKYGQQKYDFDEGIMFFIAPGQVFSVETENNSIPNHSGWILLIHPEFLWNSSLANSIKKFEYFDYSVNEALFLSEKEEGYIIEVMQNIKREYKSNIDQFTQTIIISQLELLLNYAERFYHRQFITRKITNHKILDRFEDILAEHFRDNNLKQKGLPSVQAIAGSLGVSSNYLSVLLKILTGQSTQQHIHDKLIGKAKEKLSTTDISVSAIAYELGFEHSQSFSKFFKSKTNLSPIEFRRSFH